MGEAVLQGYGAVAAAAAKLTPPTEIVLKDPKDWKLAGKRLARLDTVDKTTGKQVYGMDLKLPGMLNAAIKDSPVVGGSLKSFDASAKIEHDFGGMKLVAWALYSDVKQNLVADGTSGTHLGVKNVSGNVAVTYTDASPTAARPAPARLPPDLLGLLHKATLEAMHAPDVRGKLGNLSLDITTMKPAEFDTFLKQELEKWGKVVKAAGIKAD